MSEKRACITHDGQAYLIDTNNNNDWSPLEWWRANGGKYWNEARVAWKWLAVPETTTPSEHPISICVLVDASKRLNILGVSIEKQVFR